MGHMDQGAVSVAGMMHLQLADRNEGSAASMEQAQDDLVDRTVTFLDWDDTILASTILTLHGVRRDHMNISKGLQNGVGVVERIAMRFLLEACQFGPVVIITNSDAGWVETSAERYMPELRKLIQRLHIKIVSAKDSFSSTHTDPTQWKIRAFREQAKLHFPASDAINVLVIGDGEAEVEAASILAEELPNGFVKMVRFAKSPTLDMLNRQLSLLLRKFEDIWSTDRSMEIRLLR
mmetsp:Transcript_10630/g.32539  ORF Transcript_10630/g.32539 Transcript_10630/m.32539 type:complete len:235 (+) Transcript_10630:235-939(+)